MNSQCVLFFHKHLVCQHIVQWVRNIEIHFYICTAIKWCRQKVMSLLRGAHQKVTTGDKGGGRGQKSQNGGDVIYEHPLIYFLWNGYLLPQLLTSCLPLTNSLPSIFSPSLSTSVPLWKKIYGNRLSKFVSVLICNLICIKWRPLPLMNFPFFWVDKGEISRAQSFTSLKADLRQDINGGFVFSRCSVKACYINLDEKICICYSFHLMYQCLNVYLYFDGDLPSKK